MKMQNCITVSWYDGRHSTRWDGVIIHKHMIKLQQERNRPCVRVGYHYIQNLLQRNHSGTLLCSEPMWTKETIVVSLTISTGLKNKVKPLMVRGRHKVTVQPNPTEGTAGGKVACNLWVCDCYPLNPQINKSELCGQWTIVNLYKMPSTVYS